MNDCVICGYIGDLTPKKAPILMEQGTALVVIRAVPVMVCRNCGERYFDAETTDRVLDLARGAAGSGAPVEVRDYAAAA
jgi:YgiT-type zinc finger domain-containing protein